MVGFEVTKNFTEVRIDLLEAKERLNECASEIQNEAAQLRLKSQAQLQSEQEIFHLREQLRQQAELAWGTLGEPASGQHS